MKEWIALTTLNLPVLEFYVAYKGLFVDDGNNPEQLMERTAIAVNGTTKVLVDGKKLISKLLTSVSVCMMR